MSGFATFTHKASTRSKLGAVLQGILEIAAKESEKETKAILSKSFPPASTPGQAPRSRSGTLKNSVRSKVLKTKGTAFIYFTEEAYYWIFLEQGTVKMKPRPFSEKAIKRTRRRLNATLKTKSRSMFRRHIRNA